eukprot:6908383-Pyramimonas_sp.AAC.1
MGTRLLYTAAIRGTLTVHSYTVAQSPVGVGPPDRCSRFGKGKTPVAVPAPTRSATKAAGHTSYSVT